MALAVDCFRFRLVFGLLFVFPRLHELFVRGIV